MAPAGGEPARDSATDVAAGARNQRMAAFEILTTAHDGFLVIDMATAILSLHPLQTETLMASSIRRTANADEFLIRERCYIRELTNTPDIGAFSLAEARVEPGVTTELHSLDVDEWYILKRGSGMAEIGDTPAARVAAGDIVEIPAGTPQRITNDGDDDLVFLCLCLPRFRPDGYQPLEGD